MKHKKITALALCALMGLFSVTGMVTAHADDLPFDDPFAPKTEPTEEENLKNLTEIFVNQMNDLRVRNGLSKVYIAPELSKYSQIRAQELSVYTEHSRPDGRDCFTVLQDNGVDYRAAAENISAGWRDVLAAYNAFLNSPGHYANMMLNPATHFGFGYVFVPDVAYSHFWQMFIIEKYDNNTGEPYYFEGQYIPERELGDADGTKEINAGDARRIQEYSSACAAGKPYPVMDEFIYAADVNKDGQINAIDANIILSYAANSGVDPNAKITDFVW